MSVSSDEASFSDLPCPVSTHEGNLTDYRMKAYLGDQGVINN
jgi:hypothetical protein